MVLLHVCYSFVSGELGPTSIAVASYQFTLTIIDLRCLRNVPGPAWVSCKLRLKFMANQLRGHVREATAVELLEAEHIQTCSMKWGAFVNPVR